MRTLTLPDNSIVTLHSHTHPLSGYVGSTLTAVALAAGGAIKVAQAPAALSSLETVTPVQAFQNVANSGTPEPLFATETLARSFKIRAIKDRTTANLGNVFIGWDDTNDTGQLEKLEPGDEIAMEAPAGCRFDLAAIYVDVATADDGVLVTYIP